MFSAADVKTQYPNHPGQMLLKFCNSVINLHHVAEIESITREKYAIVFRFANGREQTFTYSSRLEHSLEYQTLQYCLDNNLRSVDLTDACNMRWLALRDNEATYARRRPAK